MIPVVAKSHVAQETQLGGTSDIMISDFVTEWESLSDIPELSVLLVYLKYVATVHQHHHWTCKGDMFYGDHQLFQRLYDGVVPQVDALAEKALGLSSGTPVDFTLIADQVSRLSGTYEQQTSVPVRTELCWRSLQAEQKLVSCINECMSSIEQRGKMTKGLDNMLAGFLDAHEGNVYLLKQRCGK